MSDVAAAAQVVHSLQTRFPNITGQALSGSVRDRHRFWLRAVEAAGFEVCPPVEVRDLVVSLLACYGDDTGAMVEAEALS